jgi:hypothetical protein
VSRIIFIRWLLLHLRMADDLPKKKRRRREEQGAAATSVIIMGACDSM